MPTRISTARRNAAANSIVDALDAGAGAGKVRLYTGSPPASTAVSPPGTLLVEFTLADPAYGSASSGAAFLITPGGAISGTALASGVAGWFRMLDSNNVAVADGDTIDYWGQFGSNSGAFAEIIAGTSVHLRSCTTVVGDSAGLTTGSGRLGIRPATAGPIAMVLELETLMEVQSAIPVEGTITSVLALRTRMAAVTPLPPPVFAQAPRAPGTGGLARFPQPAYDPDRPGAVPPVQYRPGGVDYDDGQDV